MIPRFLPWTIKRLHTRKLDGLNTTNIVEIDEFKKYLRYSNNQIIAIKALKMTVELAVNITMPLYDEIPVHKSSS